MGALHSALLEAHAIQRFELDGQTVPISIERKYTRERPGREVGPTGEWESGSPEINESAALVIVELRTPTWSSVYQLTVRESRGDWLVVDRKVLQMTHYH